MEAKRIGAALVVLMLVCALPGCAAQTEQAAAPKPSQEIQPSAEPIPAFALESLEMQQGDSIALQDCFAENFSPDGA